MSHVPGNRAQHVHAANPLVDNPWLLNASRTLAGVDGITALRPLPGQLFGGPGATAGRSRPGVEVEIRTPTTSASSLGGLVATGVTFTGHQPDHGAERRKGGPKRLHPFGARDVHRHQPGTVHDLHLDDGMTVSSPDVLIEGEHDRVRS